MDRSIRRGYLFSSLFDCVRVHDLLSHEVFHATERTIVPQRLPVERCITAIRGWKKRVEGRNTRGFYRLTLLKFCHSLCLCLSLSVSLTLSFARSISIRWFRRNLIALKGNYRVTAFFRTVSQSINPINNWTVWRNAMETGDTVCNEAVNVDCD